MKFRQILTVGVIILACFALKSSISEHPKHFFKNHVSHGHAFHSAQLYKFTFIDSSCHTYLHISVFATHVDALSNNPQTLLVAGSHALYSSINDNLMHILMEINRDNNE